MAWEILDYREKLQKRLERYLKKGSETKSLPDKIQFRAKARAIVEVINDLNLIFGLPR